MKLKASTENYYLTIIYIGYIFIYTHTFYIMYVSNFVINFTEVPAVLTDPPYLIYHYTFT